MILFLLLVQVKKIPCKSRMTQLSKKFILLINVKMPTIVGIWTFISRINTSSERLKARNTDLFQHFSFYEQLKSYAQLSWARKKFYNLRARLCCVQINKRQTSLGIHSNFIIGFLVKIIAKLDEYILHYFKLLVDLTGLRFPAPKPIIIFDWYSIIQLLNCHTTCVSNKFILKVLAPY